MFRTLPLLSLAVLLASSACRTPDGFTQRVGARASGVVADEFDATVSSGGFALTGETDYSSIEVGPTLALFREDGTKVSSAEFLVGFASFHEVDSIDLVGGGRYLFPVQAPVRPYCSLHAVSNIFEDIEGVDPGVQLGARLGAGVEIPLGSSGLYLDFGGDYTVPILPAEASLGDVELEVDGFALRIGLGFDF